MGLIPPVSSNSNSESDELDQLMIEAKDLIRIKENIEDELKELEEAINASGVGMNEPLVDASGFPRSEVDVHSVRVHRNMIIRLRNDHRDAMAKIENILHRIHEAKRLQQSTEALNASSSEPTATDNNVRATVEVETPTTEATPATPTENLISFAIVNAVAPDSPAYTAGLRREDRILKFGECTSENHDQLQALNRLISRSENVELPITILRENNMMRLTVTPKSGWGGRGLLGCHLLPI